MPSQYPDAIHTSLSILGLQAAPTSLKELNKRYHMLALQHHPDKASAHADSTEKFKEINEAHKRVLAYFYPSSSSSHDENGGYNTDDTGYDSILQLFIRGILSKVSASASASAASASANETIQSIIHQIITKGIHSAIKVFRTMDKPAILAIYDILSKNQELFGISREIMEELTAIMDEKTRDDIVIRLNPSLLDMLLDRVFILHECGRQYYIPLWHSELHYKINASGASSGAASGTASGTASASATATDGEVIVLCDPELPENVSLDDNNNLYISLDVNIQELFRDQVVPVYISDEIKSHGFVYYLHACDVTLRTDTEQSVLLRGCRGGIAMMNHNADIYNVDKRANVYANVRLVV
jgi:hypothetical protein